MCLGRHTKTIRFFLAFQTAPYQVPKNTAAGIFGAEVCAIGAPHQKRTFFGMVRFKQPHTRYPKTLLLAYLVQAYARLGRHAKSAHFLVLCVSNIPILGIQKHCCWHIWCRGMRAWGATPKAHIFWYCAFQTAPCWVSKDTVAVIFGAEVCALGAPRQRRTFFGMVHFKHLHTKYPKTLLLAYLVQWYALGAPHQKRTFLVWCISNTPMLGIQKHCCCDIWCRGMRAWGATPKAHIFGMVHFKQPHTRYPKTLLLRYLVQRCARLGRHAKSAHFLVLCVSNIPILGIQKHCCCHIWCRGMRAWGATPKAHIFWYGAFQTPPY